MPARVLYGFTIFASAYLLFQVQPLIARFILPWFGGGPGVWATCLLFFQVALLAGYSYAYVISRALTVRWQAAVHVVLLAVSLAVLPITPDAGWIPASGNDPTLRILELLATTIGLPCFLVSATAPLLQSWFGQTQLASPYKLYAISNAGSLLGLLTYPFVIEPLVGLRTQTVMWSVGYVVFVAGCALCGVLVARASRDAANTSDSDAHTTEQTEHTGRSNVAWWIALSAFGVVLLLSVTNQLTTNVAPVPFLWVVPLALYLISFIVCFAGRRWYHRRVWVALFSVSIVPTMWLALLWRSIGLLTLVAIFGVSLFSGCMVCHGELVSCEPPRARLTSYYLAIALGGVLGGAFVTVIAPLVFTRFWELQIGMIGTFLLAGASIARAHARPLRSALVWLSAALLLLFAGALPIRSERDYIASVRNFHGRISVSQTRESGGIQRTMLHGRIRHGLQIMTDRDRRTPTLYYRTGTGINLATTYHQRSGPLRMGVIGLGVGTLAAYGREGDAIRFYELNPAVDQLARRYFTYLVDSPAEISVVIGDARVSLARELARTGSNRFDVFVLDAFTSEAIPMHLLTREAFALYAEHLAPGGVMALNITNSYLDLSPVVRQIAAGMGAQAVQVQTLPDKTSPAGALWVLITQDRGLLDSPALTRALTPWPGPPANVHWSDDHSNLLRVLR